MTTKSKTPHISSFKIRGSKILVRRDKHAKVMRSGLILAGKGRAANIGTIMAVGDGYWCPKKIDPETGQKGAFHAYDQFSVGDRVVLPNDGGVDVQAINENGEIEMFFLLVVGHKMGEVPLVLERGKPEHEIVVTADAGHNWDNVDLA